jgi:hypothetical protein
MKSLIPLSTLSASFAKLTKVDRAGRQSDSGTGFRTHNQVLLDKSLLLDTSSFDLFVTC